MTNAAPALTFMGATGNSRLLMATVNVVRGDLLGHREAGLSEVARILPGADAACPISVSHPEPLESFRHVRAKF